ncbi:MAG: FAD-binding oxidoreductase [Chloroflexi bacterium]|nr:FAD-binding oxidoreductase [Chloroflexota bacterium]
MSETFDTVVIGGGVMGCATLHYLADLGITDTILLERDTLASGSTGRSTTILRMHYSNRVTGEMAWWSRDVMGNFDEITGSPSGYRENQWILVPGPGSKRAAIQNVELGQSIGIDTEVLDVDAAEKQWPYMRFPDTECVVWERKSGFADSHLVTRGFANSARNRGAIVRLGVTVTEIMVDHGRAIGVKTDQGNIFADRVVLAAGPWNMEFLENVGAPLPLHTVRHQVVRLQHDSEFSDNADPFHPTIAESVSGLSARPDTPGFSLAGYREDPVDRDTYNQGVDTDVAIETITRIAEIIPAYENVTWAGGWSGLFTVTPDWNPVIDHVPGVENLVVGAGFSGHGFKMSPAIGLSMAELATKADVTTFDLNPLRFSRFEEGDLLKSAYGGNVFA